MICSSASACPRRRSVGPDVNGHRPTIRVDRGPIADAGRFDADLATPPPTHDAGSSTCASNACEAARAAPQLPKIAVTALAEGHCPRRGAGRLRRHVGEHASSTSRRTKEAGRTGSATPSSHRAPGPGSSGARSRRDTALAIRIGVALAVARLRVPTAAAADSLVARLHRPGLLAGRIVEVRLDRRRRATETIGDLSDREALELPVMPRQGDRPTTLENPTRSRD